MVVMLAPQYCYLPDMSLSAALSPQRLSVEPGNPCQWELVVHNTGDVPEQVAVRVAGEAADWISAFPRAMELPPGEEGSVRLVVRVPRSPHPNAGTQPLVIEVSDGRGTDLAAVTAEGTLEIQAFTHAAVSLDPSAADGHRSADYDLTVRNTGNAPMHATLRAVPGEDITADITPVTVSASPGESDAATVKVRARRRLLAPGRERALRFQVDVTPDGGDTFSVGGTLRQRAWLASPARAVAVALVVLALIGIPLGRATVFAPGRRASPAPVTGAKGGEPPAPGCPAAGHTEAAARGGDSASRLQKLPPDYSFTFVFDGCHPVRFNPCEPIHYVLNPADAPRTGLADVQEAFARLQRATGMDFVYDGPTDEVSDGASRASYQPERYGQRWAPVLVSWARRGSRGNFQAAGRGRPFIADGVLVSGFVELNVDAVIDREKATPVPGGFEAQAQAGSVSYRIGPQGVTWGRVVLHELAHVVGLGHARSPGELMHSETTDHTFRSADFRSGDRAGLLSLGRQAGCLTTPVPSAEASARAAAGPPPPPSP